MQLTRKQIGLITGCGLTLVSVVVDKTLMGGPTPAAASDQLAVASTANSAADSVTPGDAVAALAAGHEAQMKKSLQASALADKLAKLSQSRVPGDKSVRDVFASPSQWFDQDNAVQVQVENDSQPVQSATQQFAEKHRLSTVIMAGKRSAAIVDSKPIRIGQRIDGFTLVEVRQYSALFEKDGQQVELKLNVQGFDN